MSVRDTHQVWKILQNLGPFFGFKTRIYVYPEGSSRRPSGGIRWLGSPWSLWDIPADWIELMIGMCVSISDPHDFRHCMLITPLSYQEHHDL